MTLGEKIQLLRKQRGLSQDGLAERLSVSRQAISKWELGDSLPDTSNVIQMSKVFEVSLDYLLNNGCNDDLNKSQEKGETDSSSKKEQKLFHLSAKILFIIGVFGTLLLIIMSCLTPVMEMQPLLKTASPIKIGENIGNSNLEEVFYIQKETRGFVPFLKYYHLEIIFCLLCFCIVVGTVLLIRYKNQK